MSTNQIRIRYNYYVDELIKLEKHINLLYNNWIIDVATRNLILRKIDAITKQLNTMYYEMTKKYVSTNVSHDVLKSFIKDKLVAIDNITNKYTLVQYVESDIYSEIKNNILNIMYDNGCTSMKSFIKFLISTDIELLIDNIHHSLFNTYDMMFVPFSIKIQDYDEKLPQLSILKTKAICDSLIENTCMYIINLSCINKKIMFEGFIQSDILNICVRTSKIYCPYIFCKKKKSLEIITTKYTNISHKFLEKYYKYMKSSIYFVNNVHQIVEKVVTDYDLYNSLISKSFQAIVSELIDIEIKTMYDNITLLMLGDEQNIYTSVLLYSLMKDKKLETNSLADIIYHNLSYYSQIKLRKSCNIIKNELIRIKSIRPETIRIEKKLACLTNMPDNVKSYIIEKNNELKSGENAPKIQMAINGLMQFPWKPKNLLDSYIDIRQSMKKSREYLKNVAKKLDDKVYGHEHSKKVLIELVGKWIQKPDSNGQVIGLVGPPGIGKTLLAKSISSALDIPLSIVGLGGMSDSSDLVGHSFTYTGAQYGMILRQMIKAGKWRSIMLFDEVDKVSKRNDTNEIYNTLIHITDPSMNQNFQDRFYSSNIEFDLSGVLIVFSYNDSSKLDPILLDRIKEIKISPYSTTEKVCIAQNYILNDLCENIGFNRQKIHIDDNTIKYIIEQYTMEAGVRDLRRHLEQILLKLNIDKFYMRGPFKEIMKRYYNQTRAALPSLDSDNDTEDRRNTIISYVEYKQSRLEQVLDDKILDKIFNLDIDEPICISQSLIHKYLEKPLITFDKIHKSNSIGVINGLYATSIGTGGIIPIQIYKNYLGDCIDCSNVKLKITGNQKQVMRESVVCALTAAINIVNETTRKNIMVNFPHGFHIHAPDGGTPKDGPSAGCAFATAFVSILLGKKINRYIAMTGEIELTGKISKIGGLETKLMGAKKAGVQRVYICQENYDDLTKIKIKHPEIFDNNFIIVIVKHIIDIVTDPYVLIDMDITDFDKSAIVDANLMKRKSHK